MTGDIKAKDNTRASKEAGVHLDGTESRAPYVIDPYAGEERPPSARTIQVKAVTEHEMAVRTQVTGF